MQVKAIMELIGSIDGAVVKINEPMSMHTTFGIGGPADILIEIETVSALVTVVDLLKKNGINWFLMGDGANLLISDKGIRGVVLHLGDSFTNVVCDGLYVTAGAAARISTAADIMAKHSLTGFEGVGTVPGSVGGAIVMNAGTHRGYIGDVVVSLNAVNPEGKLVMLSHEECGFHYRGSRFQKEQGFIITDVLLKLQKGYSEKISEELDSVRKHRKATQPQGRSAGCFFKNPEGSSAGKLIESLGLKGSRVGGAVVASEHANFILNDNNASADDVLNLAKSIRQKVLDNYGIELEFEVRIVGDWE